MAGTNLLTLLDDITTLLDDIATMSKVATKKTAGVLGDDLALNAQQVTGVTADRELPVVWAVAKGSFLNKAILVPAALLISVWLPWLITPLLMMGGLFLCFEGAEKVFARFLPLHEETIDDDEKLDLVEYERQKVKGAIRTDFILSAEIIVIVLGSVQDAAFQTQVLVVSALAIAFTVGVYGFVAGIVKLDDLGLYLLRKSVSGKFNAIQRAVGRGLLIFAPFLMKLLTIVGTIAMFLVGGGIIVHSFSWLNRQFVQIEQWVGGYLGAISESILSILLDGITGIVAGGLVLAIVSVISRLKSKH